MHNIASQLLLGKSRVKQYNWRGGLLTCKTVQLIKQRDICQISLGITERVKLIEIFNTCQEKVRIYLGGEKTDATVFSVLD